MSFLTPKKWPHKLFFWCFCLYLIATIVFFFSAPANTTNDTGDAFFTEEQLAKIEKNYGDYAKRRAIAWQKLIFTNKDKPELKKLELVNNFFNLFEFTRDSAIWGSSDHWDTPLEFLERGAGDCEDFAISKYFTLKFLGVSIDRMKITYVKALELNEAHMVLTYFPTPEADPLVLDNLNGEIKPASKRPDLLPVYSFNADGLWLAKERGGFSGRVGSSDKLQLWRDLNERMTSEGMQ